MSTHIASTVCRQHSCSLASAQSRASIASPGPLQLNLSQHQDNVIAVLLQHRGICRCCLAGKQTDTSGTGGTKHGLLLVCLSLNQLQFQTLSFWWGERFVRDLAYIGALILQNTCILTADLWSTQSSLSANQLLPFIHLVAA